MAGLLPELVDDFHDESDIHRGIKEKEKEEEEEDDFHDLPELVDASYTYFSNDNNRTVRTFCEQEIQRLQEHHMTEMQLAEHGSAAVPAAAAAAMEHQRDFVHLQEKKEQRLHREKKLQQLERISKQQHHQQREEDLQQEELHHLYSFQQQCRAIQARHFSKILSGNYTFGKNLMK